MKEIGYNTLKKEGVAPEKMKFDYACDLRYEGQFNEIEVPVSLPDSGQLSLKKLPDLLKTFNQRHDVLYGYSLPGSTAELMCLRLVAQGITEKLQLSEMPFRGEDPSSAVKARREIYHSGKSMTIPIYDGAKLGNGHKIPGPAIIEEATTTVYVTEDYNLICDKYDNYLMYSRGKSLDEIVRTLNK